MNTSKLNTETLIKAMDAAGYIYDEFGDDISFVGDIGHRPIGFDSWSEVEEWLDGVVFDDSSVSDAVEKIMHPERFADAVEPWLSEQISAMQKAGQTAINAIDRWLGSMVGFNGTFSDDKAMCRTLRRDAIDYEEICDAETVEAGAKLYWAMDTASRDEFSKIAERIVWELKPICEPWKCLDELQDAITPPIDDDEFSDWAEGEVEIRYRDKWGKVTASAIVGIYAEEIQCIDECISELKNMIREEWGESYRYD